MNIKIHTLVHLAFGYLLLPFLIFCLGFLRPIIGIPVTVTLIWIYFRIIRQVKNDSRSTHQINKKGLLVGVFLIVIWVIFSGIGGFAFQDWDHHGRNAIFRDLINISWPVNYPELSNQPGMSTGSALVYYIGFWLPAALAGKLFGWNAAQLALFIWTLLGILLTALLLRKKMGSSFMCASILIILFSGMDIIGAGYAQLVSPNHYPALWPPVSHLEWWSDHYQFSSMTSQLYWVFNQAVPTWVCMAIHGLIPDRRWGFLLWGLCFFMAPLPAIGFLFFILLEIPRKSFNPETLPSDKRPFSLSEFLVNLKEDVLSCATLENMAGGGMSIGISFLYFSTNQNSHIHLADNISLPFVFLYFFLFIWRAWLYGSCFTASIKIN